MNIRNDILRRDVFSWSLYDFANTIYSMNILSLYFAVWLVVDLGYRDIHYSLAFSASMLATAILMPALGYLSDKPGTGQRKLRYLFFFTASAVLTIAALSFIPVGAIGVILVLFSLSTFFYEGGMVFYNALLKAVSNPQNVGKISGFGVSLGYLGSIVGMLLVMPFVNGTIFGIDIPFMTGSGRPGAFLPTAFFFALFSIPIFLFVRETANNGIDRQSRQSDEVDDNPTGFSGLKTAYQDVWRSIRETEKHPGLMRFLVSDFFFEDAIATVILFMAIFTERVLGMGDAERMGFFILSTTFAMLGSYPLGRLADRFSPKRVLFWLVAGWIMLLILFAINNHPVLFWIMGPVVGILLGGVWSVSRPLLIRLSPPEKLGEFFGLFSLSGRAAAIIGPLVWGGVVFLFSPDQMIGKIAVDNFGLNSEAALKLPYRLAILALALMMGVGLFIFRKVPEGKKNHAGR